MEERYSNAQVNNFPDIYTKVSPLDNDVITYCPPMKLAGRLKTFYNLMGKTNIQPSDSGVCKECKNRISKWYRIHSNLLLYFQV